MIILPVKITPNDNLSTKICDRCLEILFRAYKLRAISLESERELKASFKSDYYLRQPPESETIIVKEEQTFEEDFEEQPEDIHEDIHEDIDIPSQPAVQMPELYEINEIYSEDLHIQLAKKKHQNNGSRAWSYFGHLMNEKNEEVGSPHFNYCKLCLKSKKIVKYRRTTATSSLMSHLMTVHRISKDGREPEATLNENFKQPKKRRFEGGSATICPECGKNFSCSNILTRHMRIHGEKTFVCNRCPSRFAFKENLHRHEKTHEENHFSRYICDTCGSKFAELKSLKSHMMRVHLKIQGEKKFECIFENCGLRFEKKYNLKKHMLTHSDQKPHECNFCDAAYASKGDLYKHLQKLHVGNALWSCEICQESFRLKIQLQQHYSVHYQSN